MFVYWWLKYRPKKVVKKMLSLGGPTFNKKIYILPTTWLVAYPLQQNLTHLFLRKDKQIKYQTWRINASKVIFSQKKFWNKPFSKWDLNVKIFIWNLNIYFYLNICYANGFKWTLFFVTIFPFLGVILTFWPPGLGTDSW